MATGGQSERYRDAVRRKLDTYHRHIQIGSPHRGKGATLKLEFIRSERAWGYFSMILLRKMLSRLFARRNRIHILGLTLGVSAATTYLLQRLGFSRGEGYWIHPRQVIHPLYVRHESSDIDVFEDVFVLQAYRCLDDVVDAGLIIDCGAYVGYSSAYLLSRHLDCQVIAVEPDEDNFTLLQRNLSPYSGRVYLLLAGVWSHQTKLVMSKDKYRDGLQWTRQVRLCQQGEESSLRGIDVGSLLALSGQDRISLLKMDVEGAEAVIFSENHQSWLDKVDAIAIELHDDSIFGKGSEVFFSAIRGHGFQLSVSGELTICRR